MYLKAMGTAKVSQSRTEHANKTSRMRQTDRHTNSRKTEEREREREEKKGQLNQQHSWPV